LNELHPDQRRDYETLREENHRLTEDLSSGREELDTIQQHLANLEGRLRNDMLRMRMQQLIHLHKEVSEKHQALQEEAAQCSLSVPEQRELLLNKVKSDNAEIVATEKRNSELKLEKERIRQALQDVAADTQERQSDNEQHKYEILFAKDQEMTQFINGFDDAKAEEEGKLKQKQDSILLLLENISKATNLQNVTPEGHLRDMEDELTFKMKEMQNSENTQCRLEGELAKRQGELDKIETLDVKITDELRQVETRMKQYEEEIENKFDRIDEMRSNGELQLRQLEERKIQLEQTVPALKQQTGVLKLKLDAKRQQAQDDEAAAALEAQEKKISQFGQTLNALATFIKQKSAETDFQVEQANCLEIANILNKALLDKKFMIP
jgi:intraflagellar transport protein 74